MRALAAPDKFRGTASAVAVAGAIARGARAAGWECEQAPIADGGEGLLDCFGGANRESAVRGPDGRTVQAAWRLDGQSAVIETARASGLALVARNDPITAQTTGAGELIAAAIDAGARMITVGAGGSASTDGGLGAVEVLRRYAPLDGTRGWTVRVGADVTTRFLEAAATFGPQKGADSDQVEELAIRLRELGARYRAEFGVDVTALPGAGAAGGLAGGLAALGARILPGFDLVAAELNLAARLAKVDLVITGEGRADATSTAGKATGALVELCRREGTAVAVIAGEIADGAFAAVPTVSLVRRFGRTEALTRTLDCVARASAEVLAGTDKPGTS